MRLAELAPQKLDEIFLHGRICTAHRRRRHRHRKLGLVLLGGWFSCQIIGHFSLFWKCLEPFELDQTAKLQQWPETAGLLFVHLSLYRMCLVLETFGSFLVHLSLHRMASVSETVGSYLVHLLLY